MIVLIALLFLLYALHNVSLSYAANLPLPPRPPRPPRPPVFHKTLLNDQNHGCASAAPALAGVTVLAFVAIALLYRFNEGSLFRSVRRTSSGAVQ